MKISNMSFSYQENNIFNNVTMEFPKNKKIGIIGLNGCGKSTLLKLMLGILKPDHGEISLNAKFISYLPQALDKSFFPMNETVLSFLLSGRPIEIYQEKLKDLYAKISLETNEKIQKKLLKKAGDYEHILDYFNQYDAENELLEILDGLNIYLDMLDLTLDNLSGGQKSKIAFARLLYSKPEILFLDEPTNHLDQDSINFLIDFLNNYFGSVFVVSHDIPFLNSICNNILYIDKELEIFKLYHGNYDRFLELYNEEQKLLEHEFEIFKRKEKKLKEIVLLYSNSSGKRKRMAESREKALIKLQKENENTKINKKKKEMNFSFDLENFKISLPIKVEKLTFGYQGKNLFKNISFSLEHNEKILIAGENGVGKSTLLKILVGKLNSTSGKIIYNPKIKIGYYAQEHESLNLDWPIIKQFKDTTLSDEEIRDLLGKFLFSNDDVFRLVSDLSLGERSRVVLAKIFASKPNLLILDEATNHLDPASMKIIAKVFQEFKGAMIVVSHNKDFVSSLNIDKVLHLPDGKVTFYKN